MSLFLINRYLGDEGDGGGSNKESRSKALLAKLQQKAEEKEKRMLTNHKEQRPEVQTDHKEKQRQPKFQTDNKKHHVEILTEHKECKSKSQTHAQDVKKKRKVEKDNKQESKRSKRSKGEETVSVPLHASDHKETVKEKEKAVLEKTHIPVTGQDEQVEVAKEEEEEEEEDEKEVEEEEKEEQKKEMQCDQSEQGTEKAPAQTAFTILGGFKKKPVQKVHRVLPQWLAQPDRIQRDITSNLVPISEVQGICDRLTKNLESNGIQHFFPVQAEVIPAILESVHQGLLVGRGGYKPRDICVSAPTGSGKTLAFVIPVIQALMQRVVCEVRVLAVLPTKELAQQVCKVFNSYAEGTGLKVVTLAGQKSFAAEKSSLTEYRGGRRCSLADIVVATPGRLVDHLNENSDFCLEHLRFLIIDEADRMIDSMHQSWLSQVTKAVYQSVSGNKATSIFTRTELTHITAASLSPPQMPLQKLLFSATLTHDPEKLQQLGLHQPRLFSSVHHGQPANTTDGQDSTAESTSKNLERFNFPQGLTELYVSCTLSKKPLLILHFVLHMKFSPILCFTNSREAAHRLYLLVHLFGGVQVAEFSSRLSTGERKRTLKDLEQGKIQMLISTDAAARGIDIKGVKYVVNYDAPQYIRTYVHRVGRTARAGKAGLALTFLLKPQEKKFLRMVRDAGSPGIERQTVKAESLTSMEAHYEQTLQELARAIKEEKSSK